MNENRESWNLGNLKELFYKISINFGFGKSIIQLVTVLSQIYHKQLGRYERVDDGGCL